MDKISQVFNLLDSWRHLPNYQLERRADIFFALYLQEVIESKMGLKIKGQIIPEFPVRIGSIYPEIDINKSYKIDYLAFSGDGEKAFLIELKTEGESRREEQDRYLVAAQNVGFVKLIKGLLDIFKATNAKKKYYQLLLELENGSQISIPSKMKEIMQNTSLRGINEAALDITITSTVRESHILYVQPHGAGSSIVNFRDFANVLLNKEDKLAARFAQSLLEWAEIKAGDKGITL